MNERVLLAVLQGCLSLAVAIKELVNSDPTMDGKIKERARQAIKDAQSDLAEQEKSEEERLSAINSRVP